jgi:threonine aldolase
VVCGSAGFIAEARRTRKVVGGGMRQAGIIAAAGITALDEMTDRLLQDHANARRLAEGIAQTDGLSVDAERVHTNIVYFNLQSDRLSADDLVTELAKNGIKLLHLGAGSLRAVTHHGIEQEDIDLTLRTLEKAMSTSTG